MSQGEGTTWHLERWGVSMKPQGTTAIGTGGAENCRKEVKLERHRVPCGEGTFGTPALPT